MRKEKSFKMKPVVDPNEEVHIDFAGHLPDEINKDAYNSVAINKCQNSQLLG